MQLFALTREIFLFCQSHHIFLRVAFIPGRRNVLADSLSRRGQVLETECMLSKPIFRQIHNLIPRIQLDLFATSRNNQLPLFVSPCPDDQAWAVDAMSLGWVGLFAYAYPPRNSEKGARHELRRCSGGSLLALSAMVPDSVAVFWLNFLWCSLHTRGCYTSPPLDNFPHEPEHASVTRVDHIQRSLLQRGFF